MKRQIILPLVCYMLMCGTLTGCTETHANEDEVALEIWNFNPVPEIDGVVCNLDTKVMFYMFNTGLGNQRYRYFGPYINQNGKYCQYINGKVVEIVIEDTQNWV